MNCKDFFKIEIEILKEQSKVKTKSNLYSILSDLNIDEDNDLNMLSYSMTKQDTVEKLIIGFNFKEAGKKFCEYLNTKTLENYNYKSLKITTNDDNSVALNKLSSDKIVLPKSCDELEQKSEEKTLNQININQQNDSMRPSTNFDKAKVKCEDINEGNESKNNCVEFYSGQIINKDDLFEKKTFKTYNSLIILRNIKDAWFKNELIRIYAENLVINDDEKNDVEKITKSLIFPEMIYIKYKHDFDPQKIMYRQEKISFFNSIKVEINQAYETKIILIKLYDENGNKLSKDLIEMYFSNKEICGGDKYSFIQEKDPFLLLYYTNIENYEKILSKEHEISNHKIIVEPLYNFEIFENELTELNKNISVENLNGKKILEKEAKDELINKEEHLVKPFIKLVSDREPRIKIFSKVNSNLINEFKSELISKNANCKMIENNEKTEILIECNIDFSKDLNNFKKTKHSWNKQIVSFTNEYFKQFDIREITVNDVTVLSKLSYDKQRVDLRLKADEKNIFELVGYNQDVLKLISNIESEISNDATISESLNLSKYQVRVIVAENFIKSTNGLFPDTSIIIDLENSIIHLNGKKSHIEEAKIAVNQILDKIIEFKIQMESIRCLFFQNKNDDIIEYLRDSLIKCAFISDVDSDLLYVYSTEASEIEKFKHFFNYEIEVKFIENDLMNNLNDAQIQDFILKHSDDRGLILGRIKDKVYICGFKKVINDFHLNFIEFMNLT